jgi:PadR family transcriptional regulator, regulatory protein PadR
MYSKELLKGTLQTMVLQLLAENDRMYGYEITQRVKVLSDDRIQLTEGALYPALHKLEAEGLLSTEQVHVGRRMRKYYRLTAAGATEASSRVQEFADFFETMKRILNLQPGLDT